MIPLDEMTELARALVEADNTVKTDEALLKASKEKARILREETIPSKMHELGLTSLELDSGEKITVQQEVYASIPVANRPAAFEWLNNHGFGGLIKVNLTIPFSKGEKGDAIELGDKLKNQGFNVDLEESVHSQTLKAFIKDELSKGNNVPLELFGARPVQTAKIKH
jgi:hypothetical protein